MISETLWTEQLNILPAQEARKRYTSREITSVMHATLNFITIS